MHVTLYCPPCAFAEVVANALRKIDAHCRISQSAEVQAAGHAGPDPALVLIDLDAVDGAGPGLVAGLAARHPRTPIVAMSSRLERKSIHRALEAGAAGYLPKTYPEPLVEGVLRLVIGGEGYRPEGRRPAPAARGSVRLPEIDATVQRGEVFGEIGIFSPEHRRTCSAICEADSELFSLSSEQVKRIHFANPQFAFFILHLVATRLMADRKRGG